MNSYALAERVHREVNASVTYRTDLQQFGVPEWWTLAGRFGDCEDYALLKRARLLESGWPLDAISLCICTTEHGDRHCVLWVKTDNGGFILDNRQEWPARPDSLPYKWESMQVGVIWLRINGWQ